MPTQHRHGNTRPLLAGLILFATAALADTGVPLYVAESGVDIGDCTDRAAPCRTLAFALGVAGKNAKIRVAAGNYRLEDPADAIYMVSGAVDVTGGYRDPGADGTVESARSMLSGVPLQLRAHFRERGFHVIVDEKADASERDARVDDMVRRYQHAQVSASAAPCAGGLADGFACSNVDLLAHVARGDISASPAEAMDVWGFVDLNTYREYVFVGVTVGTAVFDVSDPMNPREVGFIDGQSANWRDIKTYQYFDSTAQRWRSYAYVTTDGATDGLFVIDLSDLPHAVRRVPYASDFSNAHNVFVTNTDYMTGVRQTDRAPQVVVAGSGIDVGQYRSYSLSDPAAPQFVSRVASAGYMHDAASAVIDGPRAGQCAGAPATCEVLIDFNEEQVEFWEINDPAAPNLLGRAPIYANTGYVHSGWWTEDKQHVFVHDELDERNAQLSTTVRVLSLTDLSAPALVGTWTGGTGAIDHNGFVRGNRYYMSNYARGLTVLDISNPTVPVEVGFFDTYGPNDNNIFAGAWGAYPYLPSGTIAVSDINSGLYLLEDQTRDVGQGSLGFAEAFYAGEEGGSALLTVERSGGTTGVVSVDIEYLATTASSNDAAVQNATLTWADGDGAPQTVTVNVPGDTATEPLEHAIIRLANPTGGATLSGTNVTHLYVSDAGSSAELIPFADDIVVAERGFARAIVVMQRQGNAQNAVSVDYTVAGGDATANDDFNGPASGTLNWAAGDARPQSIEFAITDDGIGETEEFFEITFSNPQGAVLNGAQTARVTIQDGAGANTAPNAVAGMNQTVAEGAQVTLDGSQSNDPDGDGLSFAWSQTGGNTVALQGANSATATFTAPNVSSDTLLQFRLDVSDPRGLSGSTTVNVTVTNSGGSGASGGGGGSGSTTPLALLLLGLVIARRFGARLG